jgi:hypothetical protein
MNPVISILARASWMLLPAMVNPVLPGKPGGDRVKWVVEKSSSIHIAGRTNINHFTCGVAEYASPDTVTFQAEACRGRFPGVSLCGTIHLDIAAFDCQNRLMTDDFKKTLQYKKFPQLVITFMSLQETGSGSDIETAFTPGVPGRKGAMKGWVEIGLAGSCRKFEVDYSSGGSDGRMMLLSGARNFCFSDFGLKPPSHLAGLIKVNDSLSVNFTLLLRKLP